MSAPDARKMAGQSGGRDGEEKNKGDACEKPGQMELIAAMLAGIREGMASDREPQADMAREQAQKTDDLAKNADEQRRFGRLTSRPAILSRCWRRTSCL